MKYRKIHSAVDAMQWDGTREGCNLIKERLDIKEGLSISIFETQKYIYVDMYDYMIYLEPNDWIIKDSVGDFYGCKNDKFLKEYEKVE